MGQDTIVLTRRRLLGTVATVGVAGAGAGAGTTALFSDTETASGDIQTGTLDLTLSGGSNATFLSAVDIAPGDSGSQSLSLTNGGSIEGYVDIEVASVMGAENGCANNEKSEDTDGCQSGEGELISSLLTSAYFDDGASTSSIWSDLTPADLQSKKFNENELIGDQSQTDFVLDWSLPSSVGPEAQSDSVEFTLTFVLSQTKTSGA